MTRALIYEDDTTLIYEVQDDGGTVVGRDVEPKPTVEQLAADRLRSGIDHAVRRLATIEQADPTKVTARQVVDAVQDIAGILRHAIVLSIAPDLLSDDDATA